MNHLELFVQGVGISQIALIKVPENGTVRDVLEAAQAHGAQLGEGAEPVVLLEDSQDPLVLDATLTDAGVGPHSRLHVGTCRQVTVTVQFQNQNPSHHFSPSTPLRAVKHWATAKFGITGADATDYALQVCGSTERPSEDTHLGSLVTGAGCSICFDLVQRQVVQG